MTPSDGESGRITMVIEGLPEDNGRVRLSVFINQLQKFSATLSKIDGDLNGGKPGTQFVIVELSYNSPIMITLEPRFIDASREASSALLNGLAEITSVIADGTGVDRINSDVLVVLRGLARQVGRTVKAAALQFNGQRFDFSEQVFKKLDKALEFDDECDGSLDGMLEQINLHRGANNFHIFPAVGPKKVICNFSSQLYDEAVAAVGRKVEVFGKLRYRKNDDFPYQIIVDSIVEFQPDFETPDWEDLRGIAPLATGDLSSENFVREMRDAW